MSLARLLLVAVLVLAGTTAANAAVKDPYGPRGQWTKLTKQSDVLKQLKATDKQAAALKELKPSPDDNRAAIRKVLEKKQIATLLRLSWKAQGGYALFDKILSRELNINEDQKRQLDAAAVKNLAEHKKMRSFLARARFRSREAMQQTIRLALDKGHELTPEIIDRLGHPKESRYKDMRLGVIWLALAAGLALIAFAVPDESGHALRGTLAGAALPFCIGVAYLILYRFTGKD